MKFQKLSVNQQFTMSEYPECVCIKVKYFGGSCCTPKHNTKMICEKDGSPQEEVVFLEDDQVVSLYEGESLKAFFEEVTTDAQKAKKKIEAKKIKKKAKPKAKEDPVGFETHSPPLKVKGGKLVGGGKFGEK